MDYYRVALKQEEREQLQELTKRGSDRAKRVVNAMILLACDRSEWGPSPKLTSREIAQTLGVGERKIDVLKKCFVEQGLDECLNVSKKRNREYVSKIDGELEARLIAMSCGKPPSGYVRWSLRLLAEQVVELQYIESLSRETVRRTLKKTNSSPGAKNAG
jgi:transposase